MSYEYSSESKTFELPNPYKFQNRILFICSAFLIAAGLYCLLNVRSALSNGSFSKAAVPLVLGFSLLGLGIFFTTKALRRLRFYFGRNKPISLAPELNIGISGTSAMAADIMETLRQRSIAYKEPIGTLQGLLYHQFPKLITAPQTVQNQAQLHFINLAAVIITLLSFVVAWGVLGDAQTRPWVSLLYFVFGIYWILRPALSDQSSPLGRMHLIALIVAGVLAPVLIRISAANLPNLGDMSFHTQTFILLIGALIGIGCVFTAAISQITTPPSTAVSNELSRQSMQSPPVTLFDELARLLQSKWTEKIPNRRYSYSEPKTPLSQAGGAFEGELLEETQPIPMLGRKAEGLAQLFADTSRRFLVITDMVGASCLLIAVVLAISFAHQFDLFASFQMQPWYLLNSSFVLACLGIFCFYNSETLWGRFDFESNLVWVKSQGSYQVSKIGTGNQFSSQMQTQNDMVRVEGMTLNIWCAKIESVVFGQGLGGEARQIIAMHSTDKEALDLHNHLQEFLANQSVLVAPQSSADANKLQSIFNSEKLMAKADNLLGQTLTGIKEFTDLSLTHAEGNLTISKDPASQPTAKTFCTECGSMLKLNDKFCSQCGSTTV